MVLEPMPRNLHQMIDDRARINNEECFDDSTVRDLMKQIAGGTAHMHSRGIRHGDLKAANILVSEDREGHIVVRITDIEIDNYVIGAGFWGTPEILEAITRRDAKSVHPIYTNKSDVYSFGMLCYEILSGGVPLDEYPISHYDIVLIHGDRPKLPKHTCQDSAELINKGWIPNPAERPEFSDICKTLRRQL